MKTYFISGHRNITESDFAKHYIPALQDAWLENPEETIFIMGDYEGVDIMAQNYLLETLQIDPRKVIVYHMFDKPRNCNPLVMETKGGYKTDEERDAAMTSGSDEDIAFVYPGRFDSGTSQNILRRRTMK